MKRSAAGLAIAVGLSLATAAVAAASDWRTSAGGTVNGLAVIDTGGGPEQRPGADASLHIDSASAHLAARLELRGRIGGSFVGGSGAGVYGFDDTFQNQSPALEFPEAWLEARSARVEVRAGLQRLAWGKLDGLPPTDVLNPRDYHDPLVADFEDRKIGTPALSATWYPGVVPIPGLHDVKLSLVWLPFAVPSRLALARERWFSHSIEPPTHLRLSKRVLDRFGLCPTFCQSPQAIAPIAIETANNTPPRQLDEGGVALRLAGTWRETDWDLYHYTGPETAPVVALQPELYLPAGMRPPGASPRLSIGAVSRLVQERRRIHMTGADLATTVGGFTLRAELAWFVDRPYLRVASDLLTDSALRRIDRHVPTTLARRGRAAVDLGELFPTHDTIEWGVGADYLWNGWLPLLQINQIAFLDDPHERLLVDAPETRLTGSLKKKFFDERIEFELRTAFGIARGWWFVMPRIGYRVRDDLRVRIGYLAIGGPRASYLGQFAANDEVTFQVQYSY